MDIGETLYVTTAAAWREWLAANHATRPEIWLVFYSKGSGQPSLPYNDAVEEAICFGWIDSIVKKRDEQSRAQRFTPRRPRSPLSEMNKERVRRLAAAGKMTQAGLSAADFDLNEAFSEPDDILAALKADPAAWPIHQTFPDGYKRIRIGFIDAARRHPEVLQQRLRYFLKMTAQNQRFGMIQ
jgi:uncharacterized protein YdeI (YjbR/CyaY-like superfamily)